MVIVEAKAHEGLTRKQCNVFKNDQDKIIELYKVLKKDNNVNSHPKHIKLVILASSHYFESPSFKLKNGVGKKFINDNNGDSYLSALISWKQISDSIFPADPIFEKADRVYSEKAN